MYDLSIKNNPKFKDLKMDLECSSVCFNKGNKQIFLLGLCLNSLEKYE